MAHFGNIGEYDEAVEDWSQYTERFENFFEANEIEEAKQGHILLSTVGGKTYGLMRNLLAPVKPGTKTFAELVELVQAHFNPRPSKIVQRYKFHSRVRKATESVSEYVAALRQLTEFCAFGVTLDDMLRDRLVCGINDDRILRRLLSETELTFKKALQISTSMETADKHTADLRKSDPAVNQVKSHRSGNKASGASQTLCFRCGGKHNAGTCFYKEAECYACGQTGHISSKCRSKSKRGGRGNHRGTGRGDESTNFRGSRGRGSGRGQNRESSSRTDRRTHHVTCDEPEEYWEKEETQVNSIAEEEYGMFAVNNLDSKPFMVPCRVNDQQIQMELDTGAASSVVSEKTFEYLRQGTHELSVVSSEKLFRSYTGEQLDILGQVMVQVHYGGQLAELPLHVTRGDRASLFGRDWIKAFTIDWAEIQQVVTDTCEIPQILKRYPEVFEDGLGTFNGAKAKIYVDKDATPCYFKARPVPYALKEKLEKELDRLQANGVIVPVEFSEWAAPIVPVMKADSSLRICGDYKVTVNKVSKLDNYPIPKTDDLYATLGGAEYYSKLDLSQAYTQIPLEEESKKYTTINTHKGLFKYNRLPFGVSSAPGIFQRTIENVLQGLPHVLVRIDDILIGGKSKAEHGKILNDVLRRLSTAGLRVRKDKCIFMATEVVYLGYKINREGLHPVEGKVQAIQNAAVPTSVTEVKSYLGMLNYYGRFLPNLSHVLSPLHELLKKGVEWNWTSTQQAAFEKSKALLCSSTVLIHFDEQRPLVVCCDASPYGLGAVLSHRMDDGKDRPIGYVSRTLNPAEKNYSQLEKEGLAIIFAVKKFHQYLFGNHFRIETDHKPLLGLFSEHKAIPTLASSRIQRWALTLSAYEYDLCYKPGAQISHADCLSRLPIPDQPSVESTPVPTDTILLMELVDSTPVTSTHIKSWTRKDPVLSKVFTFVQSGWPNTCDDSEVKAYFIRRDELTIQNGCVLWGNRVIVPPQGRAKMMEELHQTHPGICRMKNLARSYIWWPNMDSELESKVKQCTQCQQMQQKPVKAPLHPWDYPDRPWTRIHIDYAGPFLGKMFLVIVDSYSKWIDVVPVSASTSTATIGVLRAVFATHGLPEMLVSDNGTCFTSEEFGLFMTKNGIYHVKTAPFHPSSNGLAERAVRTFKEGIKKIDNPNLNNHSEVGLCQSL